MIKIYTKTGDYGTSSLADGQRVPKSHPRLETYGDLDELNSFIGLTLEHIRLLQDAKLDQDIELLHQVQNQIFVISSHIATAKESSKKNLPNFSPEQITALEKQMDTLQNQLPALSSFILPGGCQTANLLHICRCVCRRVERKLDQIEDLSHDFAVYINRLSDYFFCLARQVNYSQNRSEKLWQSSSSKK